MRPVRLCAFRGCAEPVRHPAQRCPEHERIYRAAMMEWQAPEREPDDHRRDAIRRAGREPR
jgi:hypothetical protein